MKIYYCAICNKKGKEFSGNRPMVRKHLREEHLIKGKSTLKKTMEKAMGYKKRSNVSLNTIAVEIE